MFSRKKESREEKLSPEQKEKIERAVNTHGWISVPPRDHGIKNKK